MDRHRGHEARVKLVAAAILLLFAGLLARLFVIQGVDAAWYRAMARRQHRVTVPLAVRRGRIFDCRGRELALSVPAPSIFANARLIHRKKQTARRLEELLGIDGRALLERLERRQEVVCLKRKMLPSDERRLRRCAALGLPDQAVTIENGAVYARPAAIPNAKSAAQKLAPLLRRDPRELQNDLEGFGHFVWVKRRVTEEERRLVMNDPRLRGLGVFESTGGRMPRGGLPRS